MKKGEDGEPVQFREDKTCSYLEDSVETCGNNINKLMKNDCNTSEMVTKMKESQIRKVLETIGSKLADFDSCECHAVSGDLNRMKAAEGIYIVNEECRPDFSYKSYPSKYDRSSEASKGLVSVLLIPVLILYHLY